MKLLLILNILNVLAFAFWGPLFSAYAITIGASPSLAGTLYAAYTTVHALAFLFFGRLDKKNNRFLFIFSGYLIQGFAAFLFILILNPIYLFIPLIISALAGGMIAPASKAVFSKLVEEGREGKGWSYFDAGTSFALATGAFLAGLIANYYGFRMIFIPLAILNFIAAFLALKRKNCFFI